MPSTNENIDYNKFAKYTIQRWQERQDKAKIKGKGELRRSFVTHVQRDSNGDLQLMAFTFHFYGWYVDAGVGRGIRSGMEEASRRKKPWFNKVYWNEFNKLVDMVTEMMGVKAAEQIKQFELTNLQFD
jgi:hypothetical protein